MTPDRYPEGSKEEWVLNPAGSILSVHRSYIGVYNRWRANAI